MFVLVFALLVASATGLLASFGIGLLNFVLVGGVLSLSILALRPFPMIAVQAVVACLIVGQVMYFGRINQALWLPYGLGLLLFIRLPGSYLTSPFASKKYLGIPLLPAVLSFVVLVFVSIGFNLPSAIQAVVGGKNLLVLWSIYLAIALFSVSPEQIEKLFKWLIPLAFIQLPFVLYQYFFVASKRSNRGGSFGVSWDAIVGSFGGDPNSGGASGVMAFALIMACLLGIALWRKKLFSSVGLISVVIVAGFCIALAEVKVVVVLLPLGVSIIALPFLLKRPLAALAALAVTFTLMLGLLYGYDNMHYAQAGQQSKSLSDLIDKAFGYSLDADFINFQTGEMGRMAAIAFWWNEGFLPDLLHGLFGYGPGSSRISTIAIGEMASRYPFGIDRSAATQLLWDVGLLGFLSFSSILLLGSIKAYRLALRQDSLPKRQAMLEMTSAMLFLMFVMLPYGRELLEVPAMGVFMMIGLGYVAQLTAADHLSSPNQNGCRN